METKALRHGQIIRLVANVGGNAHALAAIVHIQHGVAEFVGLIVKSRAAAAIAAVEPYAEFLALAEPPGDIDVKHQTAIWIDTSRSAA